MQNWRRSCPDLSHRRCDGQGVEGPSAVEERAAEALCSPRARVPALSSSSSALMARCEGEWGEGVAFRHSDGRSGAAGQLRAMGSKHRGAATRWAQPPERAALRAVSACVSSYCRIELLVSAVQDPRTVTGR